MNWVRPDRLPDLTHVDVAAIDSETCDEGLQADKGSSWPWRAGFICGISAAWREGGNIRSAYIPLRHPDSGNFERENVRQWLKDLFASSTRLVLQNSLYDFGWLYADFGLAMPPSDQLEELGAIATLVDENRHAYGLDALAQWRGLPGKDTALLEQAVKSAGWAGRKKNINLAEHIYKLPAHLVGPYAEGDPVATLLLYENLWPILDREGTAGAYRLEVDLLPAALEMRKRAFV